MLLHVIERRQRYYVAVAAELNLPKQIRDYPGIRRLSVEPKANALVSELQKEAAVVVDRLPATNLTFREWQFSIS
jgi:hypothetical protein